jgi:hypothetical protein
MPFWSFLWANRSSKSTWTDSSTSFPVNIYPPPSSPLEHLYCGTPFPIRTWQYT